MSEQQSAVQIERLSVAVSSSGARIADDVTLSIQRGQIVGLVGESGSGKTTVAMALLGHFRVGTGFASGSIRILGRDITKMDQPALRGLRGRVVSYIPQDPPTSLNPALRIGVQLREVLDAHLSDWSKQDRRVRLHGVLSEVLLPADDDFLRRYPHQLSGGQQQRVAIAMAFACRPAVIVCDEPTTGLDVTTQSRVLATIQQLCHVHQVAALYVSHDLAVVASLANRVAVMYAGCVVEQGSRDEVFLSPGHAYTRRLLLAIPSINPDSRVNTSPDAPQRSSEATGTSIARRSTETGGWIGHNSTCTDVPGPVTLEVRALNAFYGRQHILHDVSFSIARSECLALVGESGSGKTTTTRCIGGLHGRLSGALLLDGEPVHWAARRRYSEQRRRIQYVFQNPYGSLNPRRTVGQSIGVPLRLFFRISGVEAERRIAESLERVALPAATAARFPDTLSGGERQRVAIARALAASPALLICDEVTSALDASVQASILELLLRLRQEMGLSLLFITHNLALVPTIADRVAVMSEGRILECGTVSEVLESPKSAYTRELLANTPRLSTTGGPTETS